MLLSIHVFKNLTGPKLKRNLGNIQMLLAVLSVYYFITDNTNELDLMILNVPISFTIRIGL